MPLKDIEKNREYHKQYYNSHKDDYKFRRKRQLDREKIKAITEHIKYSTGSYQSQYKDYWTLEDLEQD